MLNQTTKILVNNIASDIKAHTASRKAAGRIDSRNPETQGIHALFTGPGGTEKTLAVVSIVFHL